MGQLRYALAILLCCLTTAAGSQTFGQEFQSASRLEKEFEQLAVDVLGTLRGMPNKGSAEYACVDSSFRAAQHLNDIFAHYKFGIAMWSATLDDFEKGKVANILKLETTLVRDEIRITRARISGAIGTCSKFPLAVAKGSEVLNVMKKADDVAAAIAGKL
jgi:hypothetical protein